MQELVDRKYGECALRSEYVAEMLQDAVQEARKATRTAVETSAKVIEAAERGASDAMAEWVAWCNKHGVDIRNRSDALETDLGDVETEGWDGHGRPSAMGHRIKSAFEKWTAAGQDPQRFRSAIVKWTKDDLTSSRRAFNLLR